MREEILVLGILCSILFYECTRLSPGGLIVPGYFALCLQSPLRIGYTLGLALLTWGGMALLSQVLILYGKRRFALSIVLSYLLNMAVVALGILPFEISVIGLIIPGILVRDMEKQGPVKTILSLGIVTGVLGLVMLLMGAL
jgi:poly-gamma-glutamate biosynthesis protein PgsC/CapC